MRQHIEHVRRIVIPRIRENRLLAALALGAVAVSVSLWVWHLQAQVHQLRVAAGVEMKYRKELVSILCDEAKQYDLLFDVQQGHSRSADSITQVANGEMDLAMVPAGLALHDDHVRQVAVLDCEPLQLFVRAEIYAGGLAALKGKRLNLGAAGSGVRIIAGEVLKFIGVTAGVDYQETTYSYPELLAMPTEDLPDGIFSLSPLPSSMGERLVQKHGYRLLELPFGAAMNLRKPAIEDVTIPAHTYGAQPAVPERPLHTVGTRAVVIANAGVSKVAIRRLLAVLYESDFARRAGIPPLNDALILRSAEYPNHAGTLSYLHRHDPWINKDFIDNVMNLRGVAVSVTSAIILLWQWLRRRNSSGLNDYLRMCTKLEIDAARASLRREFTEEQLAAHLRQLSELKVDALEKHLSGTFPGDQQFGLLLARVEALQKALPSLATKEKDRTPGLPTAQPEQRKAA
jgi:TRAP-type uncharacterized transport system substrate-binding protein